MSKTDKTLFLFEKNCRHHRFDPHKKEDVDAFREIVQVGREKCDLSDMLKELRVSTQ